MRRGHPSGGLFLICLACSVSLHCAPTPPGADVRGELPSAVVEPGDPLSLYDRLGFVVGNAGFAAIGRFLFLPGSGDSTLAVFALSLPNSALRFRRDSSGFVARYEVGIVVGDSARPAAQLHERKEVRVRTFRETSRRDESIVFQGFLSLAPGDYPARVRVHDSGSSHGLDTRAELRVPRFPPRFLTAPSLVYRADPRASRDSLPSLILNPRGVVDFNERALVYLEGRFTGDPVLLEVSDDKELIWADTLTTPASDSLTGIVATIDAQSLPPGALTLRSRRQGQAPVDSTFVVVALQPEWLVADYEESLSHLRYAGTPAQLDTLRAAPARERARVLHTFWNSKDPVPETPENEFFRRYFRRIKEANDRFGQSQTAGWLTDRGAAYVVFGPPDQVVRRLDLEEGPDRSQVWLYEDSLGFDLRLVFFDPTGTGAYTLTVESRQLFREAVEKLYS